MQPTTDGLGIAIGLGLPITDKLALNDDPQHQKFTHFGTLGLGHPNLNHQLRWPYSTRYRSSVIGTQYDSSSTLSSSSSASSSSDSEFSLKMRRQSGSATRDVLLSYYFSPTLSDASSAEGEEREGGARDKVYLLSKGLKNPKYRRSKSETFRYLLPPSKVGGGGVLKSALRSTSKGVGAGSPALRGVGAGGWRRALPQLSPAVEEEVEARQGWSPYSSVAPTPRQSSGQHRFSIPPATTPFPSSPSPPTYTQSQVPPAYTSPSTTTTKTTFTSSSSSSSSSCSSQTLVSDNETDSGFETDPTFSTDAAKLARLHASLLLLDRTITELPLSFADRTTFSADEEKLSTSNVELGGSVEEKMVYLCGLGYRCRRASGRHARKGSGEYASKREQRVQVDGWWSDDDDDDVKRAKDGGEGWKEGRVDSHAPVVVEGGRAVRVVSNKASAVTSSQCSPILSGLLAGKFSADEVEAGEEDAEGDVTIRPRTFWPEPAAFEDLLGEDFSYLVDQELMIDESEDVQESRKSAAVGVTESGLMTPPLTTPELGLDGASLMLMDRWPSPPSAFRRTCFKAVSVSPKQKEVGEIEGCRPFSSSSSVDPFRFTSSLSTVQPGPTMTSSISCPATVWDAPSTKFKDDQRAEHEDDQAIIAHAHRTTISPCHVLTRPRPLRSSLSNNSLFSSASSDRLQKPPTTQSVLTRPRPIHRSSLDTHTFANKSTTSPRKKPTQPQSQPPPPPQRPKLGFSIPKSASTTTALTSLQIKVPQRKSSLDVRAEAHHRHESLQRDAVVHPNSICRDPNLAERYHSSASPYLRSSAPTIQDGILDVEEGRRMCRSAGSAAKERRRRGVGVRGEWGGGMVKSLSLPVLFTARTASQRARGEGGRVGSGRRSVVLVGDGGKEGVRGEVYSVAPPERGVLVVREEVTSVGIAL